MGSSIDTLITRLEKATGPDCKLDGEIFKLLNPDGHWVEFSGVWHRRDDLDFAAYDVPPKFTASIDAVLTLVPEGMEWSVTTLYGVAAVEVGLNCDSPCYARREDGNVAIALCIAALKARAALSAAMGDKP